MNTRVGKPTPRTPKHFENVDDNDTDVPKFEAALGEFLTSGDKDKEALSAYRSQMASMFKLAEKSVDNYLKMLEKSSVEIENDKKKFEQDKERIRREMELISADISTAEVAILTHAKECYDRFLTSISAKWESYFADKADSMEVSFTKIFGAKFQDVFFVWRDSDERKEISERKMKEAMKPFTDGIESFITEMEKELEDDFETQFREDVNTLVRKLENHQALMKNLNLSIDIEEIIESIALEHNIDIASTKENKASLAQIFISLLIGGIDPSILISATKGTNTVQFLKELVFVNVKDFLLWYASTMIVGGIPALVILVVYKIIQGKSSKAEATKELIAKTKGAVLDGETDPKGNRVPGLRHEGKAQFVNKINTIVGSAMRRTNRELTAGIQGKIDEISSNLTNAIHKLEQNKDAYADEKQRTGMILERMAESISEISFLTNNHRLTKNEIRNLASVKD